MARASGPMPNGRVVRLELLDNGLSGEIPAELGDLENLEWLNLSSNELTGEIPPELGSLARLTGLGLGKNDLIGEIPPELGDLANLVSLYLNSNRLSGGIPAELGGLSNLMWLHLHSNEISGEIPPELGSLAELTYLELHENNLTGRIPPELGSLSYLETLALGENRLSGQIPPELEELPKLNTLTLTGNRFSGCVPSLLRNVAWESDLGSLGLPLCEEEMTLFRDAWDRFQLQIPAEWEQPEPGSQETVYESYEFHFYNPDWSWEFVVIVGEIPFSSLAEYADALESAFLGESLEVLVRSGLQTSQGLGYVAFEVSSEDGEAVLSAYLLDDGTAISVVYGFPPAWSGGGQGPRLPLLRHLPGSMTTRCSPPYMGDGVGEFLKSGNGAQQFASAVQFLLECSDAPLGGATSKPTENRSPTRMGKYRSVTGASARS